MKVMYEEASPGEACEGVRKRNGAGREQTQAQRQARGSVFLFPSGLKVCYYLPRVLGGSEGSSVPPVHRVFRCLVKHYSG